ncbi:apurinic/apyrimidinic endonuclease family protein [Paracraurococcus lichenis]|uniref:UV damage endonuclease UvsE n=1 Tax=Paracraurococcus lichenis TaxID=3064888 RepID=A0ABT9DX32_9PROT|nr:UV damage endonuclease UvsE [Paracraurococcus sp. LOR1-02]MDO9708456.1 UV damage endonuclease UvsE [Paracraurococcus sp. LOR1-02]
MRIGWCCKWLPPPGDPRPATALNLRDTTVAALSRLSPAQATEKLLGLVQGNLEALAAQVEEAAAAPPLERCLRIISSVLPVYTHPVARPRYAEPALRSLVETGLAAIGARAREAGIRLSMHPGQYCVLSTANPKALLNSLEDLDYHTQVMRWLGLAGGWHPMGAHINIHGGARAPGIEGFRRGFALLSQDTRGLLTVENDETAYGLDDLLPLADLLPIVFDLHHHWCFTAGEHIAPDDPRIARIAASWRGTRPLGHLSAPREDLLPGGLDPDMLPNYAALRAAGVPARELRRHSDRMWNRAVNDWALGHLAWTDLEVEAKAKNLASHDLAEAARDAAAEATRAKLAPALASG